MSDTAPQPPVDHPTNCACPPCSALRYAIDSTAPQPPPGDNRLRICTYCDQRSRAYAWKDHHCPHCGCFAGENDSWVLLDRIAALEALNGNAFVDGAKWWEWQKSNATMWQSDQQAAFEEAKRRGFVFKPFMETVLEGKIAALEAQLAAVQQANVMARDIADQAHQRAEKAERELAEAQERLAMAVEALEKIHKGACLTAQESRSRDDDRYCIGAVIQVSSKALAATAEAVAQHTAEVERRGAAKELRAMADKLDCDVSPEAHPDPVAIGHHVAAEDLRRRAAELEGA